MTAPKIPEDVFLKELERLGPTGVSKKYGLCQRTIFARRKRIEKKKGISLAREKPTFHYEFYLEHRVPLNIENGIVLVGSDAHLWPGDFTTAQRAFLKFCEDLKPSIVALNGDVFDAPRMSRHAPQGWKETPTMQDELEWADEYVEKLRQATKRARHVWLCGNHCSRFENYLAEKAPELRGTKGSALEDHFTGWQICMSAWINDLVVIKHRFKGGFHAGWNNTVHAGKHIVCGHTHGLSVTPFSDYNGTRFGVMTGCLADPISPQFEYAEDCPGQMRSGFVVLTFANGKLLWPEIVSVVDEKHVDFRGKIIEV